jgi:hypothetical protein
MLAILRNRWFWACVVIALVGLGVWVWTERNSIQAWYDVRQLSQAEDGERTRWLARLAELDHSVAVPALTHGLAGNDARAQGNCAWAVGELGRQWRGEQAASLYLLRVVKRDFGSLTPAARGQVLTALAEIGRVEPGDSPLPTTWTEAAGELLLLAAEKPDPEARAGALLLAWVLMKQERPAQEVIGKSFLAACRTLAEGGLKDVAASTRLTAVRVAALPELNLLERVAPLAFGAKADGNPEVRSLALTAVAAHEEIASTEELLPLLHDADPEVRATCEHALRGRGLTGPHVQLARQMLDPQPGIRARVPAQVQTFTDLDTKLWLERLSKDPSPAVRAAVLRAAAEGEQLQLAERFRSMASEDPSPTVRQIANYYLRTR